MVALLSADRAEADLVGEMRHSRRAARKALEAACLAELNGDWEETARLFMEAANHCAHARRTAITLLGEASP